MLIAGVKTSPFSSLLAATYIDPPRRGRRQNVVSNLIILREYIPEEEGEQDGEEEGEEEEEEHLVLATHLAHRTPHTTQTRTE